MEEDQDWRDDPGWRLVAFVAEHYPDGAPPPVPPADAELAHPPVWASVYAHRRIVACWWRPVVLVDAAA